MVNGAQIFGGRGITKTGMYKFMNARKLLALISSRLTGMGRFIEHVRIPVLSSDPIIDFRYALVPHKYSFRCVSLFIFYLCLGAHVVTIT